MKSIYIAERQEVNAISLLISGFWSELNSAYELHGGGEDGEGRDVFEVADATDDHDGEEEEVDVVSVIPVNIQVSLYYLGRSAFDILTF